MSQAQLACIARRSRRAALVVVPLVSAWACNALTGLNDLTYDRAPDGGGKAGVGGSGSGGETGVGGSAGASNPGNVIWAIELHATAEGPNVRALELASGKLFACGDFDGVVDFGVGGNVTSVTPADAFVLSLDAGTGSAIWSRALFGTSTQTAVDLVSANAELHVLGNYRNDIDFGTPAGQTNPLKLVSAGGDEPFLATFADDANGTPVDAIGVANTGGGLAGAIASDGAHNLYLYGTYRGSPDFGSGPLPAPAVEDGGSTDSAFVVKRAPDGSIAYALSLDYFYRDFNGAFYGGLAVDALGNAYIAGGFNETFSVPAASGTIDVVHQSAQDAFLLALNPSGVGLWAKTVSGTGTQLPYAVATDSAKNAIWVGSFQGTVNVTGTGPWVATGTDSFLAKYSADGSQTLWVKRFTDPVGDAGSGAQTLRGVAVDSSDDVYVLGDFDGVIDFRDEPGQPPLTSAGSTDAFVAKYSKDGALVWVTQLGGASAERGRAITVDQARVVIAGTFSGALTLGKDVFNGPDSGSNPATFIAALVP